jgi:hypothetical protein
LNLARDTLSLNSLGKQQLIAASNLLDLIEECLVWIKPIETIPVQIIALKSRLRNSNIHEESKKHYIDLLEEIQKKYDDYEKKNDEEEDQSEKDNLLDFAHSIFEEITWVCNDEKIDDNINIGLQINRLNKFYTYVKKLLPFFLLISPLLINIEFLGNGFIKGTPNIFNNATIYNIIYTKELDSTLIVCTYMASIATAFLGGCGGLLSGLLQVRDSKTSLDLYEESMILLKIRPFFGPFAALITFILISWNVFSEILTSNPSSLFLAAFLSGFSERYFLKLLKIEPANQEKTTSETDATKINKEKD